ncbi:MAG TPA: hypothetical protein VJI12_04925 [archaeon]|nr:hypothetical protein [archaeon]
MEQVAEDIQDYWNEYIGFAMLLRSSGFDKVKRLIRENPVQTYTERFLPEIYGGLMDDVNKNKIQRLDRVARYVNKGASTAALTESDFKRAVNLAHHIIYGKTRPIPYEKV